MELRLKEFRKARGWTQREVAERAGMSQSYYTELELGRKQINANRLDALARVFDVAPQELLVGEASTRYSTVLQSFAGLDDDDQKIVVNLIESLSEKRKK